MFSYPLLFYSSILLIKLRDTLLEKNYMVIEQMLSKGLTTRLVHIFI